jgi:hypothetical protein
MSALADRWAALQELGWSVERESPDVLLVRATDLGEDDYAAGKSLEAAVEEAEALQAFRHRQLVALDQQYEPRPRTTAPRVPVVTGRETTQNH